MHGKVGINTFAKKILYGIPNLDIYIIRACRLTKFTIIMPITPA